MSKIFISFFNGINAPENPNAMPCFYETFIGGLKESGNDLLIYSDNKFFGEDFKKIPQKLLNQLKEFNPDLLIFFNNYFYDVSKEFDCPIIIYEVDSPLFYSNKDALKGNISRYKFFVPQSESVKILTEQWGANKKNIFQVPFFTEIKAEKIPQTQNISFIASKFTNDKRLNLYNKFMQTNPNEEEIRIFKDINEKFKENPFLDKSELLKYNTLSSAKISDCLNETGMISLLTDFQRVKTLSAVADLGLSLYGSSKWITDLTNELDIILSFKNRHVYSLKHNQDIYNSSKIGINICHIQAKTGFPWRICDIMASNACLLTEYKPDFDIRFPNIKIPFFSNPYEAREQCVKLLNNENMRSDIVASCNKIIDKKYRFSNIKKIMEDYLNMDLSSKQYGKVSFIFENVKTNLSKYTGLKNKIRLKIYNMLGEKLRNKGLIK